METSEIVYTVRIDYICDMCGVGRMKPSGAVQCSYPPSYAHRCDNAECGATMYLDRTYPAIEYRSTAS